MFKLVKVPNKNTGVPEMITIKSPYGGHVKAGGVYFLADDSLTTFRPEKEVVLFYVTETLKSGNSRNTVRGFIITPGMIFLADVDSPFTDRRIGHAFTINSGGNDPMSAVLPSENGDGFSYGILLSIYQTEKTGKVYVMFN